MTEYSYDFETPMQQNGLQNKHTKYTIAKDNVNDNRP